MPSFLVWINILSAIWCGGTLSYSLPLDGLPLDFAIPLITIAIWGMAATSARDSIMLPARSWAKMYTHSLWDNSTAGRI